MVPTNTKVFCVVYDYAGKADLGKGCWNLKRKLGVTMHFSVIFQIWKENAAHCSLLYGSFKNYACLLISEKCLVTNNFPFGFQ